MASNTDQSSTSAANGLSALSPQLSALKGRWDAAAFFEDLVKLNRLARESGFRFCRVSGLEGFEEAVASMQATANFFCVSDIADGFTELNNTPRTRRVKTVFMAMRHAAEDMAARSQCMETMRELFRQFMSRLLLEKVRLEQNCIYIDPRISFTEIDRYFFNGAAGAYFQIAVDVYTDLRYCADEWRPKTFDLWLVSSGDANKIRVIKAVRTGLGLDLPGAKKLVEQAPVVLLDNVAQEKAQATLDAMLDAEHSVDLSPYFSIVAHGERSQS